MVAISPISFGLGNLSVAKWVTLLSVLYLSIVLYSLHDNLYNRGLAGVRKCGHTNVAITFERMNIFTCGKKHMVAWIFGNRRGVRALARAQIGPWESQNSACTQIGIQFKYTY